MSSSIEFVKRLYDISVKDVVITGVFIIALITSVGLGITSRQNGHVRADAQTEVATTSSETEEPTPPAEEENDPGTPFPGEPETPPAEEQEETTPPPAPAPTPAPAPSPAPQPQILATAIPNTGPGETAAVLFAGATVAGYAAYAWHLRCKATRT